jgi:hypothetical protein
LILLLDLLYLHIIVTPDDAHALRLCHVLELLEIALDISLVRGRVEYLYLKSDEVVSEGLQYDKHYASYYHLIHIACIFDPNILKTNNILPAPFDAQILISMQEI